MSQYHCPDAQTVQKLRDIANKLRIHSIQATDASKSGHPTSCCSAAEIMSVLFFNTMRYTIEEPKHPNNDRFVLSKGHAAPILYAAWAEAGLFPESELLKLRKIDSDLEGHPTPRLNFVDVATGSLGQGLSCAAGMAYTGKYFDKADYRVFCLIGDGESAEGSIWEAMAFASHYKLDNLVAIFDVNRLGQSEPTSLQHELEVYRARAEAFGWNALIVDGHSVEELTKTFWAATQVQGKPTCIVAKTFKGQGVPGIADEENWHGKPLGAKSEAAIKAIQENIINKGPHGVSPAPISKTLSPIKMSVQLASPPAYKLGENVATRLAYGTGLVKIGKSNDRVVAMDGDTKNSTFAQKFKIVRQSKNDQVTVVASCVTLFEAMKAADSLAASGVNIRIIDPFTIKPIDAATIIASAQETGGKIITVEDHYAEGGIGSAVSCAVSEQRNIIVKRLYVPEIPRSGPSGELLEKYGISASCIVKAVQSILSA
ncbi:transketolase [Elysia marginata]|uniref:Transketolase n=1 Tax=Elysia marginata TaxID=1093978 RepID=A0AAV4JFL4_9GAST|nr:transketolase [Elysia marginata]